MLLLLLNQDAGLLRNRCSFRLVRQFAGQPAAWMGSSRYP